MKRRTPRSTRTAPLFPDTTLFRSLDAADLNQRRRTISALRQIVRHDAAFRLRRRGDRQQGNAKQGRYKFRHDLKTSIGYSHIRTRKARAEVGRSEEHTSELQSLMRISYAVFCLKKKKHTNHT